jgi:hypothetical protein
MSMFDGPYCMPIKWVSPCRFTCPYCGRPIHEGQVVIAYPWPRCEVWHVKCAEDHLDDTMPL